MRNYLIYFFGTILCTSILAMPIAFFPYSVGEFDTLADISENQLNSDEIVIYGTALNDITHSYKSYMLEKVKPDIIALGSSRVMPFKQQMFKQKFYNLGGVMDSADDGFRMLEKIKKVKTKLLLLGVDSWWFNPKYSPSSNISYKQHNTNPDFAPRFNIHDVVSVSKWILKGELSLELFKDALLGRTRHIGIRGIVGEGFGVDGSIYHVRTITGGRKFFDEGFEDTLNRVRNGTDRFQYAATAHRENIKNLIGFIKQLQNSGIETIVFFPSYSPPVYALIKEKSEHYRYMPDLKSQLVAEGVSFFDFEDPASIQSGSCEFYDGFHHGEVSSVKILHEIAIKEPNMLKYVSLDELSKKATKYSGLHSLPDDLVDVRSEIDFLKIGCKKSAAK